MREYKYDVAFSFLAGDSALAVALADLIAETNTAFAFPRRQEELVARDGVEELKRTYGVDSRVVVILYRPKWGSTPWTGVEKEAIADRALQEQQDFLLVVALESDVNFPDWVSRRRIYWNFPTYGKTGLAGAIKTRIAEMDGNTRPESPVVTMQRVARIHSLEDARKTFRGEEGAKSSAQEFHALFSSIKRILTKLIQLIPRTPCGLKKKEEPSGLPRATQAFLYGGRF